jgi:hypothetical protein
MTSLLPTEDPTSGAPDPAVTGTSSAPPRGDAEPPGPPPRGRRRWRSIAAVAVVTIAAGAGGIGVARARNPSPAATAPPAPPPVKTATVSRTDLVERLTVDGTLSYGATRRLASPRPGTLTWLPAVGTTVDRGQPLARIDEREVPLLLGAVPLYRNLAVGAADGADVRQLEENLVALGHGLDGLVVDDHFDWATRAAVQSWQRATGAEETGAVRTGDLVFSPTAVRVATHEGAVGDDVGPGRPLVTVTGVDRSVTVKLDVARQSHVNVGDAVQVELPDQRSVGGRVTEVSSVAERASGTSSGSGARDTIPVTIALDDPAAAGRLEQAPVSVRITERQAANVLAVPIKALLALQEGGYAVEVVGGGDRRYVLVTTGAFAGGLVEVQGELQAGDTVVVAS